MIKSAAVSAMVLAAVLAGAPGSAQALTYTLNTEFSGSGSNPAGPAPWGTAIFDDLGSSVRLTLSLTAAPGAGDFLRSFYFNLDPALNPLALAVVATPNPAITTPTVSRGVDAFKADGDGEYDVLLGFQNSGGAGRFNRGESMIFELSMTGVDLDPERFAYLSKPAGGNGPFFVAGHMQGLPDGGSAWVTEVPLPAAAWLTLSGLVALGGLARRLPA